MTSPTAQQLTQPSHWLLLLTTSGHQLLSCVQGRDKPPFATVGLMSAVQLTAQDCGFSLRRVSTNNYHIGVKVYLHDLVIAWASSETTTTLDDRQLEQCMDRVFDGLVMLFGERMLEHVGDMNKMDDLKRRLLGARHLLAIYLHQPEVVDITVPLFTNLPELCISTASHYDFLELLCDNTDVAHAALYSSHRLVATTPSWDRLHASDVFTIGMLLRSLTPARQRDLPVYLARSSMDEMGADTGKVPYRLVTVALVQQAQPGLEVVLLCGREPSMAHVVRVIEACLSHTVELDNETKKRMKKAQKRRVASDQLRPLPLGAQMLADMPMLIRHMPARFHFLPIVRGFLFVYNDRYVTSCCYPTHGEAAAAAGGGGGGRRHCAEIEHRLLYLYNEVHTRLTTSVSSTDGDTLSTCNEAYIRCSDGVLYAQRQARASTSGGSSGSKAGSGGRGRGDGGSSSSSSWLYHSAYVLYEPTVSFVSLSHMTGSLLEQLVNVYTGLQPEDVIGGGDGGSSSTTVAGSGGVL